MTTHTSNCAFLESDASLASAPASSCIAPDSAVAGNSSTFAACAHLSLGACLRLRVFNLRRNASPDQLLVCCSTGSTCPRVPPPTVQCALFRRDLQTKSHPTIHPATTPYHICRHSQYRSSSAVPERAHVPIHAVLPLFAHLEISAQCLPPQHLAQPPSRSYRDEGPGRPRGLVWLKVARAGWRNRNT